MAAAVAAAVRAIPGPPRIPVLGNTLQFIGGIVEGVKANKPYQVIRDWHNQYGPLVSVDSMGIGNSVFLSDPELVKYVARNDPARFTKGTGYETIQRGWLDGSLVVSEGEVWRKKRDIYNKAFRLGAIRSYAPIFEAIAKNCAEEWRHAHQQGMNIDAVHGFESVAFEAIGRAGFGVQGLGAPGHKYAQAYVKYGEALNKETNSVAMRLIPQAMAKWITRQRSWRHLQQMTEESQRIVKEASESLDAAAEKTHRNLVGLMKEAIAEERMLEMDAEQLAREANLFLFAGHDTTSSTLSWASAMVGSHPEVQRKLHEEVLTVKPDALLEQLADPRTLPYLGAVIKETLRLYPPAGMVVRNSKYEEELAGYRIPAGVNYLPCIWAIQREPTVFDGADDFRPERWLEATPEQAKQMQDHWMPFMIGARSCIGLQFSLMEMRIVLTTLLRDFKIELVSKPQVVQRMVTLPSNISLKVTPRV